MNTLSFVLATIATGIAWCADRSFEITSVVAYKVGSANDPASPLRRWSIERISAPARLYILCEVRNNGDSVEDVFIVSHMDFVVAPTSQYGTRDLDSLQTEVAWGEQAGVDDVKLVRVPSLAPGEKRAVRLSGFDLKPLLKHYDGTADTLWPWWVRVHVRAASRTGTHLASGRVIFALIPPKDRIQSNPKRLGDRHPPLEPVEKRSHFRQ